MSTPEKPRVFRLRNLPGHSDRLSATKLLSQSLGIDEGDILISSLASDVDKRSHTRMKVATLTFQKLPLGINSRLLAGNFLINSLGLADPMMLDDRFQGVTPLNDVAQHRHTHE